MCASSALEHSYIEQPEFHNDDQLTAATQVLVELDLGGQSDLAQLKLLEVSMDMRSQVPYFGNSMLRPERPTVRQDLTGRSGLALTRSASSGKAGRVDKEPIICTCGLDISRNEARPRLL